MNKKIISIIICIIVGLVVVGLAYYFGLQQGKRTGYDQGIKAAEESYKKFLEKSSIPIINPAESLPTTNPFEGIKVNPFEGVYKNPFK